jgi:alanine dehydrogenase
MTDVLLLSQRDVQQVLSLEDCIDGVERAFAQGARGEAAGPESLSIHAEDGNFHVKAAALGNGRRYFAAKVNANHFRNLERGLPRIQGVVVLCDAGDGRALAIMDSIYITALRTAAATAVATKYLAPENASTLLVCGCGVQGQVSVDAIGRVRQVRRVFLYDLDSSRANALALQLRQDGTEVRTVSDFREVIGESDVCVTCTPSRRFFLHLSDAHPGLFIAAVGADSRDKQEIEPALLAAGRVVVDDLEQCATFGDLRYALENGSMTRADVAATLGEVIIGARPGRTNRDDVIVFDSTGTALQDVAAATVAYERALARGVGTPFTLT